MENKHHTNYNHNASREISVNKQTDHRLDDRGSIPGRADQICPPPQQPPLSWFPGVRPPEREADHSPAHSAEVENAWCFIFIYPIRLHSLVLVYRDNFSFSSNLITILTRVKELERRLAIQNEHIKITFSIMDRKVFESTNEYLEQQYPISFKTP
jgi:hypothetical protein